MAMWSVRKEGGGFLRSLLGTIGEKRRDLLNLLDMNLMNCLPYEVCLYVFSFLDAKSIMNASKVCVSWNVIANDLTLWKHLYEHNLSYFTSLFRQQEQAETEENQETHQHEGATDEDEDEGTDIGMTIFADENEIRSGSLSGLVERLVADKPPGTPLFASCQDFIIIIIII